ncbi:S8 family peptidase [Caldimonas tepidiphila]|uniref:S8 family peptidase n=1 Tax=Caldimonas tepidiphila TaxID=2315841 RepID=UPI000E5B4006|nr:S8 family peptidase [Caldimonas tepidiphila]
MATMHYNPRFSRWRSWLLPLLLLILSLFAASSLARAAEGPAWGLIVKLKPAGAGDAAGRESPKGAPTETPQAARERLAQVLGERVPSMQLRRTLATGSHLVDDDRVLDAAEARALAERLAADPRVEYVVPNVREQLQQVVPNDPYYRSHPEYGASGQWWLKSRVAGSLGVPDFPAAWARGSRGNGTVVAVLDSGITSHPELNGQLLPGYDFVSEHPRYGVVYANDGNGRDSDPSDPGDFVTSQDASNPAFASCEVGSSSWHGTRIAGQIAAVSDNRVGVAGIVWQARILPVRVSGKCGAAVADIVDGMLWAVGLPVAGVPDNPVQNRARILNLSFGGSGECNAEYASAIASVRARDAILVTAAGNERGKVTRPGNCAGVISVGALNREGFKATYSNLGPEVTLSTVGGDGATGGACDRWLADDGLLTLSNTGERGPGSASYAPVGGTSFSTPVVSGVAALMLSIHPNLTIDQLRDGLVRTVQPHVQVPKLGTCSPTNAGRCSCTESTCGAGILDADQALAYAETLRNGQLYQAPDRSPVLIDNAAISTCAARVGSNPEGGQAPGDEPPQESSGGGAADLASLALLALAAGTAGGLRRRRNAGGR